MGLTKVPDMTELRFRIIVKGPQLQRGNKLCPKMRGRREEAFGASLTECVNIQ